MTDNSISSENSEKNSQTVKRSDRIVAQALSMAFGTMSSRVLGLVREQLFLAFFSRTVTDAWGVAFRLPNMLRRLLGEGSLSVSFIPVFIDAKANDTDGTRVTNLVNGFYTMLLIILACLTTLGILFAEPLISLLGGTYFAQIPGKFELTVRMARIMFSFIFLMSTYAYFMGILNAMGRFGLPAMAPTFFNIAMIISNFWPSEWQTYHGDALAWGVIVGGILQTGVLIPALIKCGYFPKLSFKGFTPDIMRVWRGMLPGISGMGLLQLMTVINSNFAASQGEASNSWINAADRLLELPLSLVSVSLGTALLPTLAKYWTDNEKEKMLETANFYLRLNLLVGIPAAAGLFLLSRPIIELLFGYGKFGEADIAGTSSILKIYALTLIFSSSVRVMVPTYYAIKNTWFPAVVSAICLLIHFFVAPMLMEQMGLDGLALSTSLSAGLNFVLLLSFQRKFIGHFGISKVVLAVAKIITATLALAGICMLHPSFVSMFEQVISLQVVVKSLAMAVTLALAVSAYILVQVLIKSDEMGYLRHSLVEKIKRKLGRA